MKNKFYISVLLVLLSILGYAQNDTIKLVNNDVLVGEIKQMDRSVLVFSTSYDDSDFKIKWGKVKEIKSDRRFIVSLSDGDRITTTINSVSDKEMVVAIYDEGEIEEY